MGGGSKKIQREKTTQPNQAAEKKQLVKRSFKKAQKKMRSETKTQPEKNKSQDAQKNQQKMKYSKADYNLLMGKLKETKDAEVEKKDLDLQIALKNIDVATKKLDNIIKSTTFDLQNGPDANDTTSNQRFQEEQNLQAELGDLNAKSRKNSEQQAERDKVINEVKAYRTMTRRNVDLQIGGDTANKITYDKVTSNLDLQEELKQDTKGLNSLKQNLDKKNYFETNLGKRDKDALFSSCKDEEPCSVSETVMSDIEKNTKESDTQEKKQDDVTKSYIKNRAISQIAAEYKDYNRRTLVVNYLDQVQGTKDKNPDRNSVSDFKNRTRNLTENSEDYRSVYFGIEDTVKSVQQTTGEKLNDLDLKNAFDKIDVKNNYLEEIESFRDTEETERRKALKEVDYQNSACYGSTTDYMGRSYSELLSQLVERRQKDSKKDLTEDNKKVYFKDFCESDDRELHSQFVSMVSIAEQRTESQ